MLKQPKHQATSVAVGAAALLAILGSPQQTAAQDYRDYGRVNSCHGCGVSDGGAYTAYGANGPVIQSQGRVDTYYESHDQGRRRDGRQVQGGTVDRHFYGHQASVGVGFGRRDAPWIWRGPFGQSCNCVGGRAGYASQGAEWSHRSETRVSHTASAYGERYGHTADAGPYAPPHAPPPVYLQGPPVYVQPPEVRFAPPVVYRAPPVYVQQPPVYVQSPPVYVEGPEIHVAAPVVEVGPARVITDGPVHLQQAPIHVASPPVYVEGPQVHVAAPDVDVAPPTIVYGPPVHVAAPPVYVEPSPVHVASPDVIVQPAPPPPPPPPMPYYGDEPPPGNIPPTAPPVRHDYRQEPGERG